MTQSLKVQECFGYHSDAIKRCSAFKFGMRAFVNHSADDWLNSCSICVNPTSSPESVAVCGSRITKLLGNNLPLGEGHTSHVAVVLDSVGALANPVLCMEAVGALLFRESERVVLSPPIQDPTELLRVADDAFSQVTLPKHPIVKKVFGSIETGNDYARKALLALFLRDVIKIHQLERRDLPTELMELARKHDIPLESLGEFLDQLKPLITSTSLQNEWASVVDALYDRPPIPRGFSILKGSSTDLLTPEPTESSSRRTAKKRSYKDLLRLEMSSGSDSDSDSGSKSVRATRTKRKVPETELQPVIEFDNWLQCDKCMKWRKVDANTVAAFEDRSFTCTDVPGKSCADPSES